MNIVVLDDYEHVFQKSLAIKSLSEEHRVTIYSDRPQDDEQLYQRLKEADIVIPIRERTKFTSDLLNRLTRLKFIAQTGTGTAHIDLPIAERKGIKVCNMPGTSATAVAELTILFILSCLRRLPAHVINMRDGLWKQIPGRELKGKTVGIIGYGSIGKETAKLLKVFQTRVMAWSPSLTEEKAATDQLEYGTLDHVLSESDIVTIHLRAVPKFRNLIDRRRLLQMKRGAILINTSRSLLVDMQAVEDLLEDGHLYAAGLDVFDIEPLPGQARIRQLSSVTLTPHIGYITEELLEYFANQAVENIKKFISDEPLPTLIV